MRRINIVLFTIITVISLPGCDFINNSLNSKNTVKEFIESLIEEDYNKSYTYFDHPNDSDSVTVNIKQGLINFRELIVNDFGTELNYTFMNSEKKISTIESENTPPNTTLVFIQISNTKSFGVLKIYFDDNSHKIKDMYLLDVKKPIPSMAKFWLFGLLAICVPVFIIYIIRLIKHRDLKKKWLKYIAVILLNVPAITYNAVGGFSYSLLSFQILFGVSFNYMGYLNSAWTFGIPLGGLYWLWKLKIKLEKNTEMSKETEINLENIIDKNKSME